MTLQRTRETFWLMGSFAQRYVKRHAPVRERAETRRLCWYWSPHLPLRFQDGFWGRPPTEAGTFHHTLGQVECSQNPGIRNGGIWTGCLAGNPAKHVPQLCPETGVPICSRERVSRTNAFVSGAPGSRIRCAPPRWYSRAQELSGWDTIGHVQDR